MRLEAGDRADRVGQQRDARQPLGRGVGQMLHQMLDGGAHAVAAGLAGDQQPARAVQPGDRVLVQAAAGGVGQLLVQWLKHFGAWVVGTTSSETKAEVARAAGADVVINYGHDYQFLDELLRLTEGRGVDLAFDSVGAATFAHTVKGLARGGSAVSFGVSSGPAPAINPAELINPCTRIAGGSVFSYIVEPGEFQRRAASIVEGIEAGWLRMPEATVYPLARAADAHRDLESRLTHGKLYLVP